MAERWSEQKSAHTPALARLVKVLIQRRGELESMASLPAVNLPVWVW